ncbi:glycine/D-amino acid oxidase-like deaminating enzyme [Blastomonas natatoria]|uniref:Glycine/D-amino acid oxidase-like deaminating enzyme n=1 Tax=Blastomonas natatoria TaxID=34015 RepID=A0A2V3UV27_9SPHN|nr:FAD-binding oxidoreductase [Blastomonas natatoria]PXW70054.1 glycine/D-amino acid oxidase-like deaminating enzyme [Blastomonas natatoria]
MKNFASLSGSTALVVGGGLVGLTSALALQRAGASVTLIEPFEAPRGASWGNAGHIAIEQVQPLASAATIRSAWAMLHPRGALALPIGQIVTWGPFALKLLRASSADRFASGTAALSTLLAEAMPAWRRLCDMAGASHLLREDGHFVAWESAVTAARGRAFWLNTNLGTATVRDATAGELADIRNLASRGEIVAAIRFAGSGQIADLGALADALRALFRTQGGAFRHSAADAIAMEGGQAAVRCGADILRADHVLLCAGAASAELLRPLGIRIPLIAERGYHIQSAASRWPQDMPPVAFEDRSMIVTRFAGGLRAASFVEFAARAAPPDPAKWQKLRHHVAELGLPFDPPGEPWMGARPTLPDYLPAIGRSQYASNLLYAFGHQHLGMTLAAITGELIGALAADQPPAIDLAPFDPARFGGKT